MTTRLYSTGLLVTALLAATPVARLEAQLGGLKKKLTQATQIASAGEPVAFDDAVLELTPERIGKVISAKATGRRMAAGPEGPNAIRQRLDDVETRATKIYEAQVGAINAWDEKRQDAERCLDSVLVIAKDKLHLDTDPAYRQKMTQLSFRMAQAQQRGDTAEIRKLTEDVRRAGEPTAADSARARQACPVPPAPPAVREWQALSAEAEQLKDSLHQAEQAVREAEQTTSGMNHRQLGIACERILLYLARAKAKEKQKGFTSEELAALEAAIKELQGTCA